MAEVSGLAMLVTLDDFPRNLSFFYRRGAVG
jgi:hypothetical protein